MNEAHVELVDVTKAFQTAAGSYVAVQNVSLEIGRGEVVALVGHSGCGKSTLVNLVAGLAAPTRGEIRLRGRAVAGPGPDRAMVFQNYSLLPWLNVWSNIFEAVDSVLVG